MNKLVLALSMISAAVTCASPALAGTTVDTTAPYTGDWTPFGQPNTTAYGQTFTAGSDNVLNSFSLYLDGPANNGAVNFTAYIYAWTGSAITGPALYTSASQTFTGSTTGSPTEFAFNTGGTTLTAGAQYVAFLFSTSGGWAGMPYSGAFGSNPYPGGAYVYDNVGTNFSQLSSPWDNPGYGDVWFKADFTSGVPEPATWAMMLLGFGGIGVAMRRRSSRVPHRA
jgi:PEP-CTERM motif